MGKKKKVDIKVSERDIVIKPNSKPQIEFFKATDYEVLFGGSAGSGKTFSLVVDPLRYVDYSQYSAIIFRRTYPELEGSVIPLTHHYYLNAGAVWNETKKQYTFPSGAKIRLGFMQYLDDWRNFQGSEYTAQYYDELTNFEEEQYTMLAAWNRSKVDGIKPYRRAASNPGGVGMYWVKKRFVDVCRPVPDGEMVYSDLVKLWWQPMKPGDTYYYKDEIGQELSRKFIPARVFDNIDNLRRNPNYVAQLMQLPETKRKMLLDGNWDIAEGMFFDEWNQDVHVVGKKKYLAYHQLAQFSMWGGLDYGKTTALELVAKDYNNNIIVFDEWYDEGGVRSKKISGIKKFLDDRGLGNMRIIADTNMWIPDAFDVAAPNIPAMEFINNGLKLIKVSKKSTDNRTYRISCNDAFKDLLHYEKVEGHEEAFSVKPRVIIYERCKKLIETIPLLAQDRNDPEDFEGGDYDHCFAKDTQIQTNVGSKNIQDVKVGDYVLTSLGYEKVLTTHVTENQIVKKYIFSDGTTLVCTPNHPIWTYKKEFVAIDELDSSYTVAKIDSVVHIVAQETIDGKIAVYNLTVENTPEYYANGILVHNCFDAGKMAFMQLYTPRPQRLDERPLWLQKLSKTKKSGSILKTIKDLGSKHSYMLR